MGQHRSTISSEYETDFFAWTQHQAKLLRGLDRLRLELPGGLDLSNLVEEIESSGRSDLSAVKSWIRQIMVHLIKAVSDPQGQAIAHWRTEATSFHIDLLDRYTPSMRQLIDMQVLWEGARKIAELALGEHDAPLAPSVPAECPYSVQEIVSEDFQFDRALARLSG